ncbi:IS3 family transposase [Spiroplasma endosymbiont of Dioctria linearis]|uniref:IS3 family transposase n=1 Tax=Spiroplasma endosymbiont of Dioctria linearis TaxID=3066290 RepID=UPI00313C185F
MKRVNRKYDLEFKNKVISEITKNNYSIMYAAKLFKVNFATINTWLYKNRNPKVSKKSIIEIAPTKKELLVAMRDELNNNSKIKVKDLLIKYNLKKSYWDKYKNIDETYDRDFDIYQRIKKIFDDNLCQFGYRRIRDYYIKEYNTNISTSKVLRIMRKYSIISNFQKRANLVKLINKGRTKSDLTYKDLIRRDYKSVTEPNKVWYTDVTYLVSNNGKLYVSTIIDGSTREVIDYKISNKNNNEFIIKNLKSAINKTKRKGLFKNGMIIHSDKGSSYKTHEYASVVNKHKMIISMGRTGVCYDNIVIESFHSLLKKGTIHNNKLCKKDISIYKKSVIKWYSWYSNYKKQGKYTLFKKL